MVNFLPFSVVVVIVYFPKKESQAISKWPLNGSKKDKEVIFPLSALPSIGSEKAIQGRKNHDSHRRDRI